MFDKSKYTQNYIKENYERLVMNVPKGYKEKIMRQAKENGYSNMSAYIVALIEKDSGTEPKQRNRNIIT